MPVSHIGLTVSHLPTSCSFFLSALQPLGYRFIGQQGSQIGLGIHDADFFLCQETPGVKAGAAHIALTAPSRTTVRDFYAAALTAGGRPNGAPASRNDEDGHFNAAILDLDGNSIEVVFRDGPDVRDDGTVIEHSRVITWQRTIAESFRDDRSVVSRRSLQSSSKQDAIPPSVRALSKAPSVVSQAPSVASGPGSIARSVSEPVAIPKVSSTSDAGDGAAKKIIGTLLGAAAGAAVAYAMVRSEQDSAKKESDFVTFLQTKAQVARVAQLAQTVGLPTLSLQDPQPIYESRPKPLHRNISDTDSHYSTPQARSVYVQHALEPAPQSDFLPAHTSQPSRAGASRAIEYVPAHSVAPSRAHEYAPAHSVAPQRAIEYAPTHSVVASRAIEYAPARSAAPSRAIEYMPAHSVAPSRSHLTVHRSMTSPELPTEEKARSTVSKSQSVAQSVAPSSFISSFVPDEYSRRDSEGSVASHRSSRSKAKSSHTHASRHTSHSKHGGSRSRAPSPQPSKAHTKTPSKAASIVGSILGRETNSNASKNDDFIDDFEIEDFNDTDSVAPSDSISNAGSSSRRSRRSHRSSREHGSGSEVSKHSSSSRHSKSSKHSGHSHSSKKSHSSRSRHSEYHSADEDRPRLSTVVSEPSDASTVRPSRKSSARKDSLMQGQYEQMFSSKGASYGNGTVANVPIRGITQSMVDGGDKESKPNVGRSVISYAMGQKLRAFERQ